MANMSYCRFQNTVSDLRDCYENWNDIDPESDGENDRAERRARQRIMKLCKAIVEDYGDDQL